MSKQRENPRLASMARKGLASIVVMTLMLASGSVHAGGSSASFSITGDGVVSAAGSGVSSGFSLLSAVDGGPSFRPLSSSSFNLQRSGALGAALAASVGEDTDDDGVADRTDNCDFVQNADQENFDGDAFGDACDDDDDNDGTVDLEDELPFDPTDDKDTDGDLIGNKKDRDDDGDGVDDRRDAFPLDAVAVIDTDRDGKPDSFRPEATAEQLAATMLVEDEDDDEDGLSDDFEEMNGLNSLDARDARADADRDNFTNKEEHDQGTDLNDRDDWTMPTMTGENLAGHTHLFEWDFPAELPVRKWLLQVGTTPGGRDVVRGVSATGTARSLEVGKLPTQGGQLFVTLNFDRGRGFRNPKPFTFNAADLPEPGVTPAGGSLSGVQVGGEATFQFERNDNDVTHWSVEVFRPSSSGRDARVFRRALRGTDDSVTVTGLPTFGELVVLRLGYRLSGRAFQFRTFEFTTSNPGEPEIVTPSPTDGSADLLATPNNTAGNGVEFTWTANGQPVTLWRLYVGTTRGGRELYRSRNLRGNVLSVDTRKVFPQSPVHVRLFYRIGRAPQRFVDYLYNPLEATLRALYPATQEMGLIAPVRNDGADIFSASGRLCRGRERGGHEACLQAGLMKVMTLPSTVVSCADVTVSDALDAFEWQCRDTVPVEVVSVGLKRSLTELIDVTVFGSPAFKANQVIVDDDGTEVARSVLEPWWSTPVVTTPVDGVMRDPDTVYVVEVTRPGNLLISRAPRSVLVAPGVGRVDADGVAGGAQVTVSSSPFALVQGNYAANGESTVILVDRSAFAIVTDVSASGAVNSGSGRRALPGTGIRVRSSSNVMVSEADAFGNESNGIMLEKSAGVWVMESSVLGNGTGVLFSSASGNGLFDVRVGHNTLGGVLVTRSSDNRMHQLVVNNNGAGAVDSGGHGIEVDARSVRNVIGFSQVFNNAGDGVYLGGARNTLLHNVTAFNHPGGGVVLSRAIDTTLLSVLSLNNGEFGVGLIGGTQRTRVEDLVSAHNGVGVALSGRSRRNTFAGVLKVGGNGMDCEVETGSDSLGDGDCAATGSSTHTVVAGVDAGNTLVGKRSDGGPGDDGVEDHDTLAGDVDLLEDLGAGEGTFSNRGYGRDGGAFPGADQQGPCITGETCRIWDGALRSGDTGDGGNPVAAGVLAIPGAEDVVSHRFRRFETLLLGASEVLFDGLGDEDGLCESGEACNLDLNLGAFQGEEGDGIADEVIGFDLTPAARNKPLRVEDVDLDARTATTVNLTPP